MASTPRASLLPKSAAKPLSAVKVSARAPAVVVSEAWAKRLQDHLARKAAARAAAAEAALAVPAPVVTPDPAPVVVPPAPDPTPAPVVTPPAT